MTRDVLSKYPVSKRGTYQGLALQEAPQHIGQRQNQAFYGLYDEEKRKDTGFRNGHFTKINAVGEHFAFVFEELQKAGIVLLRGRVCLALANNFYDWHYDNDFRIHVPVFTNLKCQAIFEKERFHMAADGGTYLHNGYLNHAFENMGFETRVHIVFVIGGLSFDTHDGSSPIAPFLSKLPPGAEK